MFAPLSDSFLSHFNLRILAWDAVFSVHNAQAACEWDYPAVRSGEKP